MLVAMTAQFPIHPIGRDFPPFSIGDSISKLGVITLESPKTLPPLLGETVLDASLASSPSQAVYAHCES